MTDAAPMDNRQPLNFTLLSFALGTNDVRKVMNLLESALEKAHIFGTVSQTNLSKQQEKLVQML